MCTYIHAHTASSGFRDDSERFLVDFERKKWDEGRHSHEGKDGEADPLAIVGASDRATVEGADGEDVRKELVGLRDSGKSSAEELKAKRLEAAKKRMQLQQQQKEPKR